MADSTPLVPKPLIEWLEKAYPNDINKLHGLEDRLLHVELGRQSIIRVLRVSYNQQNKTGETA